MMVPAPPSITTATTISDSCRLCSYAAGYKLPVMLLAMERFSPYHSRVEFIRKMQEVDWSKEEVPEPPRHIHAHGLGREAKSKAPWNAAQKAKRKAAKEAKKKAAAEAAAAEDAAAQAAAEEERAAKVAKAHTTVDVFEAQMSYWQTARAAAATAAKQLRKLMPKGAAPANDTGKKNAPAAAAAAPVDKSMQQQQKPAGAQGAAATGMQKPAGQAKQQQQKKKQRKSTAAAAAGVTKAVGGPKKQHVHKAFVPSASKHLGNGVFAKTVGAIAQQEQEQQQQQQAAQSVSQRGRVRQALVPLSL
jgi:hypothetical protein